MRTTTNTNFNKLWVSGFSGSRESDLMPHDLITDRLSPFWADWSKKRKRELAIDMWSAAIAFHLARMEARARQQIERHAGRSAALSALYGHEFSHGAVCSWINVNDDDVPEHLRADCEQHLYCLSRARKPAGKMRG